MTVNINPMIVTLPSGREVQGEIRIDTDDLQGDDVANISVHDNDNGGDEVVTLYIGAATLTALRVALQAVEEGGS